MAREVRCHQTDRRTDRYRQTDLAAHARRGLIIQKSCCDVHNSHLIWSYVNLTIIIIMYMHMYSEFNTQNTEMIIHTLGHSNENTSGVYI